MSTVVIDVDNKASAKLFLELAKKMQFKARVLSDEKERRHGAPGYYVRKGRRYVVTGGIYLR